MLPRDPWPTHSSTGLGASALLTLELQCCPPWLPFLMGARKLATPGWEGQGSPGQGRGVGSKIRAAEPTPDPSSLVSPVPCKVPASRLGALSACLTPTTVWNTPQRQGRTTWAHFQRRKPRVSRSHCLLLPGETESISSSLSSSSHLPTWVSWNLTQRDALEFPS